jgi:hypothetical protein
VAGRLMIGQHFDLAHSRHLFFRFGVPSIWSAGARIRIEKWENSIMNCGVHATHELNQHLCDAR